MWLPKLAPAALLTLGASCASGGGRRADSSSPVPGPESRSLSSSPRQARLAVDGTTIHYVDYGGVGPTLVLLAGLGNTAHVFAEFAPRFTDSFRVVALTRRGFGESGRPSAGFATERLSEDVRVVLDSLALGRVVLVGHSVAGDEMSDLAVRYPDRVAALVYLDAAYDRSGTTGRLMRLAIADQLPPAPPSPTASDRGSVDAYRRYLARIYGVTWPEGEVRATRVFDDSGRYVHDASAAVTNLKILRGERRPEYERIAAPVLAIYSVNRSIERDQPWISQMAIGRGVAEAKAQKAARAQDQWERDQRRQLAAALPTARIVEVPNASHYLFISHADLVERAMREFLARR